MTKEQRTKLLKPITIQDVKSESFFCVYEDLYIDEKNLYPELSQEAKIVYFIMRNKAAILNKAVINFSIKEIIKYERCSEQKAKALIDQLVNAGLISVNPKTNEIKMFLYKGEN